jgi:hypothetical protein
MSTSNWQEVALLEALKDILGPLYSWFRLMLESLRRMHCGVPGTGVFREARVFRLEDWLELGLRVGCVVCTTSFSVVTSAAEPRPRGWRAADGEIEVTFELDAGSLRRVVRQGVRGYTCSAVEGLLPPFTLFRVGGMLAESKRAIVGLVDARTAQHPFHEGLSPAAVNLGSGARGAEADAWFGMAASARRMGEATGYFE